MEGYDEEEGSGVLAELKAAFVLAKEAEAAVEEAEAELKRRSAIFNRYKFVTLPEIIERAGGKVGTEIIVEYGDQRIPLKLEEKMHAKLSDAKRDHVLAFMKAHNAEHLFNNNVVVPFTRGQQEELKRFIANIDEYNKTHVDKVTFGVKEEIHPSTYAAWCNENLRDNPSVDLADFGAHLVKQVSFGKPKANKQKGKK